VTVKIFRWKAVGPLLGFGVVLAILWWLFADRIAHTTTENVGTRVLGARVDIDWLNLDLLGGKVELRGLTVASPQEPMRNLFQAEELVADVDLLPLLEKKVVIDRLAAKGLRFGTPRTSPGFEMRAVGPGEPATPAEAAQRDVIAFVQRLDVPLLNLATGKVELGQLDPGRLETVRAAEALGARADSSSQAWRQALDSLRTGATVDSVEAAVQRLRGARATDLAAINDARRTLEQVKRARDQLAALERGLMGGVTTLRDGVRELDAAKQRDYAFARSLVRLPTLDAPNIGAALFGGAALARFQQALYWASLARRYMPPGLLPQEDPGPKRVRLAGTNVRFPRERAYPGFLLREGEVSFQLAGDSAPRDYAGRIAGLTSQPALYGRPTTFDASAPALRVGALLDHVGAIARDTAAATIGGVRLPAIALPGLPVTLEPGRGDVTLAFALQGDSLRASWAVRAGAARWARDTAAGAGSTLEQLVTRVLQGIARLDLRAEVRGTIAHPSLAVRSNLDEAVAASLRAELGAEVAAAERRVRGEVDRLVDEKAAPVRARVTALADSASARLGEHQTRLEAAQRALEQRIRELARLPGLRLP
jgi:uncharacterized protein (TIGR03545 family)